MVFRRPCRPSACCANRPVKFTLAKALLTLKGR
jgi:hypothetical protein